MKRILALYLVLLFWGCSYAQKDVKTLLEDPMTVNYQKNMDDLERSYLRKEISYPLEKGRFAWLQVAHGSVNLNKELLGESDGAEVSDEDLLKISANKDSEILLFDLS